MSIANLLLFHKDKVIHIIGIGGIGMSAIAKVLYSFGYKVQGSDMSINQNVQALQKFGMQVFSPQHEGNVHNVSLVIRSTAIGDDNIEVVGARKNNILVISRAEILTELLKFRHTIAISGTHGKTTTTSMVGSVLEAADYDPTVISGGIMNLYNDNVRLGRGDWNVVEADESDGTFTSIGKSIGIVTNIELDHIDYYKTYNNMLTYFREFMSSIPFYGFLIACIDSPEVANIISNNPKIITYGVENEIADVRAVNVQYNGSQSSFDIVTHLGESSQNKISDFIINVPGVYNVYNAVAAIALAIKLNIDVEKIKVGLQKYSGVKRRFSFIGKFNGADVIDDYAHHPTEIVASIEAAKQLCTAEEKVIAVIQPHRFTRVESLFGEYKDIALHCDNLIFLDVYAAGEKPIINCSSKDIVMNIDKQDRDIRYLDESHKLAQELLKIINRGDKILMMGAGDITKYAHELASF